MAQIELAGGRRHGESLAPAIRSATELAGVTVPELGLIAVDHGPGLFTGLRVGVATAKALASALGTGLASCSSLELLAHPHRTWGRPVASVVDARRGEVFWAVYEPDGARLRARGEPGVSGPDEVAAALASAGSDLLVVGDGARRYLTASGLDVAPPEFDHPGVAALAEMAAGLPAGAPEAVTPLYLRGADVRIGWEQR
jgi:tRNA threonylcarbamoyladenosine biosynthesis protein TsaB